MSSQCGVTFTSDRDNYPWLNQVDVSSYTNTIVSYGKQGFMQKKGANHPLHLVLYARAVMCDDYSFFFTCNGDLQDTTTHLSKHVSFEPELILVHSNVLPIMGTMMIRSLKERYLCFEAKSSMELVIRLAVFVVRNIDIDFGHEDTTNFWYCEIRC